MKIRDKIVEITPAMAKVWLDTTNTRNRNLTRSKVNLYKSDMTQGRWSLTHQGIAFYENGELADGQHRLQAIVESQKTIRMRVFYNLNLKVGADIDRHKPRSEADSIRIGQLSDWMKSQHIQIIKMIIMSHKERVTNYPTRELVEIGELMQPEIQFAVSAFPKRAKYITTSPVYAAVAIASMYEDHDRLREFAEVMSSGMPQSKDDVAAVKLREQLIREGAISNQQNRRMVMRRVMRAIKAFCQRQHIERLHTPDQMLYRMDMLEEVI